MSPIGPRTVRMPPGCAEAARMPMPQSVVCRTIQWGSTPLRRSRDHGAGIVAVGSLRQRRLLTLDRNTRPPSGTSSSCASGGGLHAPPAFDISRARKRLTVSSAHSPVHIDAGSGPGPGGCAIDNQYSRTKRQALARRPVTALLCSNQRRKPTIDQRDSCQIRGVVVCLPDDGTTVMLRSCNAAARSGCPCGNAGGNVGR